MNVVPNLETREADQYSTKEQERRRLSTRWSDLLTQSRLNEQDVAEDLTNNVAIVAIGVKEAHILV